MAETILKPCSCKHEYQDKKYGLGIRVHNVGGSKDIKTKICTVCGNKAK